MQDHLVSFVVSEWDDIDDVRAWEHNGVHVEVQHKWEPQLLEPLVHRRLHVAGLGFGNLRHGPHVALEILDVRRFGEPESQVNEDRHP
jgi:hypothetical protein